MLVSLMENHSLHRLACVRFKVNRLPVDTKGTLHRVVWKRIDDFTVIIHEHLIRKFLPNESSFAEHDFVPLKRDTIWRVISFVGLARKQKDGHQCDDEDP